MLKVSACNKIALAIIRYHVYTPKLLSIIHHFTEYNFKHNGELHIQVYVVIVCDSCMFMNEQMSIYCFQLSS